MASKFNRVKTRKQKGHTGRVPDSVGHRMHNAGHPAQRPLSEKETKVQNAILNGDAIVREGKVIYL